MNGKRKGKSLPDFSYESKFWEKGLLVGGADEVGRGALAGPVMAGFVVFKPKTKLEVEINDSKLLSPRKREEASLWIKQNALLWAIGESDVKTINQKGIVKATQKAFRRAINHQSSTIIHLLLDAFYVPYINGIGKKNQTPIIKGDQKSISIAAASIIAKVERDATMTFLSKQKTLKIYEWDKNKGYGTKSHKEAIIRFGASKEHRKQFISSFFSQAQSEI